MEKGCKLVYSIYLSTKKVNCGISPNSSYRKPFHTGLGASEQTFLDAARQPSLIIIWKN